MKLTDNDEARQSLLSESRDHSLTKEKCDLQRRRRRSIASEKDINYQEHNVVAQSPLSEAMAAKSDLSFKKLFAILSAYLGTGTLCFFLIRHQLRGIKTNGFLDAIYFCVVTMTTVGYGDLVPNSILAKLLACVYVFIGMAIVGMFLSKAADYIVEKQEIFIVRAVCMGGKVCPAQLLKEAETNKVKYKFFLAAATILVLMITGTLFLYLVENLDVTDAFYCVCSTITTLGYGDESFSTTVGRSFAVFWILSSTICLAQFFLYLAEMYAEGRQRSLIKLVLARKLSLVDLEAADLDHDKSVSPGEFLVHKLKEMGKISQEDISVIMERFKKLDVDHSGTLTEVDLKLSESTSLSKGPDNY